MKFCSESYAAGLLSEICDGSAGTNTRSLPAMPSALASPLVPAGPELITQPYGVPENPV